MDEASETVFFRGLITDHERQSAPKSSTHVALIFHNLREATGACRALAQDAPLRTADYFGDIILISAKGKYAMA